MKRLIPAGLALVAAMFLSAVPALASDNANAVHLYKSFACGGAPAADQVPANDSGFVNLHQDGTTVTVIFHIRDAAPNTVFDNWGTSSFCGPYTFLGQLTTNSHGEANGTFTFTAPAGSSVWTFSSGDSESFESVLVSP